MVGEFGGGGEGVEFYTALGDGAFEGYGAGFEIRGLEVREEGDGPGGAEDGGEVEDEGDEVGHGAGFDYGGYVLGGAVWVGSEGWGAGVGGWGVGCGFMGGGRGDEEESPEEEEGYYGSAA